jgi:hypothetical protein
VRNLGCGTTYVGIVDPIFQEKNRGFEHQEELLEENFIPLLQGMSCDPNEIIVSSNMSKSTHS